MPHKPRLKFIDLARSIAILLMLEGHFVELVLADESRKIGHPIYVIWDFLRGFSAPLFFTVAGMIFVFLLTGGNEGSFFQQVRVRKGLLRALELFLWGYLLQIKVWDLGSVLQAGQESWIFAFHVLHCIGAGLLALILLAGTRRSVRLGSLECWYAVVATISMVFFAVLATLPENRYVPADAHALIQNAIKGPYSVFPVAPWLAFTFLGGAMGAHLRSRESRLARHQSCRWIFLIAAALQVIYLMALILPLPDAAFASMEWFTQRAFQVVAFLGLLRWIEIRHGIRTEWLLRAGRETFTIYILHVIVLYGAIFDVGFHQVLAKRLNAWQSAGGAVLFLSLFLVLAQWLQHRKRQKTVSHKP